MSTILNSLLIPYSSMDNILIPNELVECVLPYAIPLPPDSQHPAVVGSVIYKDRKVPIVNLDVLEKGGKNILPRSSLGKYRIVMLSSISEDSFCDSYAVITNGRPLLVKIAEDIIEKESPSSSPYFHSKVELYLEKNKKNAYVPDLEEIEAELFSQ